MPTGPTYPEPPTTTGGQVHAAPFAIVYEWLLDADVSDRAVRLYAVLGRYANTEHRAFPGRATLAERLRCSPSSIDRALDELAKAGAVAATPRHREDGSRSSNDYWLWPAAPPVTPPLFTGDQGGLVTGDQGPYSPVTTRNESQLNDSQLNEETRASAAPVGFAEFWLAYPRKVGKPEAEKAWRAMVAAPKQHVDAAAVLAGLAPWLAYWAERDAPEFVPHPSTWLRQQRWNDQPPATLRRQPATGPRAPVGWDRAQASGGIDL